MSVLSQDSDPINLGHTYDIEPKKSGHYSRTLIQSIWVLSQDTETILSHILSHWASQSGTITRVLSQDTGASLSVPINTVLSQDTGPVNQLRAIPGHWASQYRPINWVLSQDTASVSVDPNLVMLSVGQCCDNNCIQRSFCLASLVD